jgi:peptide/nickel transport system ATP-binding protein
MLEVSDLTIDYATSSGRLRAVAGVGFTIASSEVLGLVGESGSGKSSVGMTLLGHVPATARVAGRVLLRGEDLLGLPQKALASYRGRRIGFVPQNPAMALSPHLRIGSQFHELVLQHGIAADREEATDIARAQFALVGLAEPDEILRRYPHELSGGQQQRVCIAMAIACRPELLVLDEPTTGLDVTTQARIIDLIKDLRSRFGMAMLYVTHDLGVLSQIADRIGVMYAGRLVELAAAARLLDAPRHPYTRALIASVPSLEETSARARPLRGVLRRETLPAGCPFTPRCDYAAPECAALEQTLEPVAPAHQVACWRWRSIASEVIGEAPRPIASQGRQAPSHNLVELQSVDLTYHGHRFWPRLLGLDETEPVVRDLSFAIGEGEIFALVGESGSGKSTIARALSGLLAPVRGSVQFRQVPLPKRLRLRPLEVKRAIQYVFQNPDASLNPRERVRSGLARPLRRYFRSPRAEISQRVAEALEEVRLDAVYADRFPDQLSGGERQRIAIARSVIAQPSLILCDEVLSALDVSVQASIIELLARLRQETGVAMLFISHDLAVVRLLADRTGVLFRGTLVESGSTEDLFEPPFHPYTEELLLAVPSYRNRLRGRSIPPHVPRRPTGVKGCVYAARCRHHRGRICDEEVPPWRTSASGNAIRCHIPLPELAAENLIGSLRGMRASGGQDRARARPVEQLG